MDEAVGGGTLGKIGSGSGRVAPGGGGSVAATVKPAARVGGDATVVGVAGSGAGNGADTVSTESVDARLIRLATEAVAPCEFGGTGGNTGAAGLTAATAGAAPGRAAPGSLPASVAWVGEVGIKAGAVTTEDAAQACGLAADPTTVDGAQACCLFADVGVGTTGRVGTGCCSMNDMNCKNI